jgi:hypothetical protein
MVRPTIYEWKSRFQERKKTANILNKQSHKAQKSGPLLLGPDEVALTFNHKELTSYEIFHSALKLLRSCEKGNNIRILLERGMFLKIGKTTVVLRSNLSVELVR